MSGAERVTIEVRGLETFGPHGVTEEERVAGCRIVLDIALDVEAAATASDEKERIICSRFSSNGMIAPLSLSRSTMASCGGGSRRSRRRSR